MHQTDRGDCNETVLARMKSSGHISLLYSFYKHKYWKTSDWCLIKWAGEASGQIQRWRIWSKRKERKSSCTPVGAKLSWACQAQSQEMRWWQSELESYPEVYLCSFVFWAAERQCQQQWWLLFLHPLYVSIISNTKFKLTGGNLRGWQRGSLELYLRGGGNSEVKR